jgi:hypothetical protein
LLKTALEGTDAAVRRQAVLDLIADQRATEVLELTGIAVLSDDPDVRRLALRRLDDRGAADRAIGLIRSWRREGALMGVSEQMNADERSRAAEIEAAHLLRQPLVSVVSDAR